LSETHTFVPAWRALAIGFVRGFSALSGVLAAFALLLVMTTEIPSVGTLLSGVGLFAIVAFGRLDADEKHSWIDWAAGALVVIGALWCVSESWRGAPVQYTTLAFFAVAGSVFGLFGIHPRRTGGRHFERWMGAALGIAVCVAAFWPWIVVIFERLQAFLTSPETGVGAEISAFWMAMVIALLVIMSIAVLLLLMDRLIEMRERRELLQERANG
jgi:uncharacterized membrane protein YjdF